MLEKSEDEVSKWNDDLAKIQEEVENVERVCEQPISTYLETLKEQRKDAQVSNECMTGL